MRYTSNFRFIRTIAVRQEPVTLKHQQYAMTWMGLGST